MFIKLTVKSRKEVVSNNSGHITRTTSRTKEAVYINPNYITSVVPKTDGDGAVVGVVGEGTDFIVLESVEEVVNMVENLHLRTAVVLDSV